MKPFTAISIFVLSLMALAHALRAIAGASFIVADVAIPVWFSWPVALVFGLLAFMLWGETRR